MEKITLDIARGWMPDLSLSDITKNGGLYTVQNVLPVRGAYYPAPNKAAYNTTAAADKIIGGTYVRDTDGQYYSFIGTLTKLYRYTNSALTNITRASGGDYSASYWSFEKYGSWTIATDFTDDPQILKDPTGANFVALGGSPPKARYCLLNHGHLILAYLDESGTIYPKKIKYSAREDVEDWTTSLTTGCGSQDFPDMNGNITGLASLGDGFVITSDDAISYGYYIGGEYTYGFRLNIIRNIGCFFPQSLISIGDKIFFWSKYSIYSFDGESLIEIGARIKRTIFVETLIQSGDAISVAHDKANGLIKWAFPYGVTSSTADKILVYNYLEDKFTILDMECDSIFMGATEQFIADSFTDTLIDNMDFLIDSTYWYNKNVQPMIGNTDYKINAFTGSDLTATIETGEINNYPQMFKILKAYLPIEGSSSSGSAIVKHRYSDVDAQSSSSSSSLKSDGTVDLRTTNRKLALNFTGTNFDKINTIIDIEGIALGRR